MDNKKRFTPVNREQVNKAAAKLGVGFTNEMIKPRPRDLFSFLEEIDQPIKEKIERAQKEKESLDINLIGGLSATEQKAIFSLMILLHQKSESSNIDSPEYYLGNKQIVLDGERAPAFVCSLHELTRIFIGDKAPSGQHLKNTLKILERLSSTNFYFQWEETYKATKKGDPIRKTIQGYRQLLTIDKEIIELKGGDIKQEYKIVINPILTEGIKRRFILIPQDLIKRIEKATGGSKILKSQFGLITYFLLQLSSKNPINNIRLRRLFDKLDQRKAQKNPKQLKKDLIKGLEICIKMGLILSYEIKQGETGELKLYFKPNKKYIEM